MIRKTLSTSLALCGALAALFLSACSSSSDVEGRLVNIREYMQSENYSAAEIELKNVLREDPRNPEAVLAMGELYFQQGRFRDAFPFLNGGKAFAPEDLDNRIRLSSLLIVAGQPARAREEALYVLSVEPSHPKAPLLVADSIRSADALQEGSAILSQLERSPASLTASAFIDLKRQAITSASEKFDQALKIDPEFSPAYTGKYAIALALNKPDEASSLLEKAAQYAENRTGTKMVYADHMATNLGKTDEAIAYLEAVYKESPDYLPIATRLAELYAQVGRTDESAVIVEKALKLDQLDPTAMRLKGVLATLKGENDKAITALNQMLELYPQDIKANYQISLAYIANNQPSDAKSHLERVAQQSPSNIEAAALLANIQSNEGDHSGAVITLKRLVANRPNSPEAKLLLAEAFNKQGNFEAALAIYDQVDAAGQENPDIDFLSGVAQLRSNNPAQARQAFEEALKSNPLHLQSVEQLTALDLSEQSYQSALQRVNSSLELAPDTAILYVIKAQIQNAMGQREEAEQSFLKAIELDPVSRAANVLLSRFYASRNELDKAKDLLEGLLEELPEDLALLTTLASYHELEKDYEGAIEYYERIVAVAPRNLTGVNNLAYLISIVQGPTDRAAQLAEQARQIAPTSPYTGDTLGWILYQRGEYARAHALLVDSIVRLPENQEVNFHVGAASYMLGDLQEAEQYLARATEGNPAYSGIETAQQMRSVLAVDAASASSSEVALLESLADEKDPVAAVKLARVKLANNEADEGIALLRSAYKANPNNLAAKLELTAALAENGAAKEAIEIGREAAKQAPNNIEVTFTQGIAAYHAGDYTWASSLLSQSSRQLSNRPKLFELLSESALATGDLQNAIASADRAATLLPDGESKAKYQSFAVALRQLQSGDAETPSANLSESSLLARLLAANSALQNGDQDAAKSAFEKILSDYPNQAQAKLGLANTLLKKKETPERAYELASQSRSAIGSTPKVLSTQGQARYQQKQYDQAYRLYSQISSNALSDPEDLFYFGMAAKQTDRADQAKELLQKAIESGLQDSLASQAQAALQTEG